MESPGSNSERSTRSDQRSGSTLRESEPARRGFGRNRSSRPSASIVRRSENSRASRRISYRRAIATFGGRHRRVQSMIAIVVSSLSIVAATCRFEARVQTFCRKPSRFMSRGREIAAAQRFLMPAAGTVMRRAGFRSSGKRTFVRPSRTQLATISRSIARARALQGSGLA